MAEINDRDEYTDELEAKVRTLERELNEAKKETERLFDLVRYQRAELHQENLISDDEYVALLADSESKKRLETYDDMRQQLTTAKDLIEKLVGALRGYPHEDIYTTCDCMTCKALQLAHEQGYGKDKE